MSLILLMMIRIYRLSSYPFYNYLFCLLSVCLRFFFDITNLKLSFTRMGLLTELAQRFCCLNFNVNPIFQPLFLRNFPFFHLFNSVTVNSPNLFNQFLFLSNPLFFSGLIKLKLFFLFYECFSLLFKFRILFQ